MRNLSIQFMILATSVVLGVAAAMQGLTLILPGIIFICLLVMIALTAPEPAAPPIQILNRIFAVFLAMYVLWPSYISVRVASGIPGLNPPRVLYILLLFFWALSFCWSSRMSGALLSRLKRNPIPIVLLAALVLWKFVSIFNSDNFVMAFIEYLTGLVGVYVVFLFAISTTYSIVQIDRLLYAIAIGAFVISLLGIYEAQTKHLIFAHYVTASSEFIKFALSDKERGGTYRAQGTFIHPLLYAEFLLFSLPVIGYVFSQQKSYFRKFLLLCVVGVVVVALLLARSRAGVAALVVVVLCALVFLSLKQLFLNKRSFTRFFLPLASLLFVVSLLVAVGPYIWDAIHGSRLEYKSTLARLYFLKRGISLVSLEPVLGYGGAREAIAKLGVYNTVDNYYLSLALEAGIPALILFLLIYAYFVALGIRLFFIQQKEKAYLALALTLSLLGFAVFNMILSVPFNHPFMFLAFALIFVLQDICLSSEIPTPKAN